MNAKSYSDPAAASGANSKKYSEPILRASTRVPKNITFLIAILIVVLIVILIILTFSFVNIIVVLVVILIRMRHNRHRHHPHRHRRTFQVDTLISAKKAVKPNAAQRVQTQRAHRTEDDHWSAAGRLRLARNTAYTTPGPIGGA